MFQSEIISTSSFNTHSKSKFFCKLLYVKLFKFLYYLDTIISFFCKFNKLTDS